ncbi:acetyl-CoA carboxylase biotin carboxylase subunit [Salinispora oceanensis]|uniref:acetyl-CoA carboxylase biotin carboxylase subunit n=1 Tax=Salinispora oceanensis TaxID=1050199 RepID=UPI00035E40E8|nr:acetyl-CoA carboxylase biotin carboxylase subunit [Salinispora oceanensis]
MFNTVLIANRGEIGLRVARTCREMGIRTVAVYATADRDSAVTRFADEALHIGPTPAKRSYLNIAAVVEAALRADADAIHPGYGFLSEDADLAEVAAQNGITFIGPRPEVMLRLSDKAAARAVMADAGLPVLPGSRTAVTMLAEAEAIAQEIDYPLIIKAAAGGGGRGMTVVWHRRDLPRAFAECRSSAQAVFNDSRVYLERYLESARHVEIQVLCDNHGNAIHLGERDCSVQRRHQKLIEEAPAPNLPPGLADEMGAAAVRGALAVGYSGVGTFEFLVDEDGSAHFMEINCRIQVEHPVTEMVTGIDLIREQIRVAAGRPLELNQADVTRRGAAIECRVNAEDPTRDFRPTPGRIDELDLPGGPFVRVDTHCRPGWTVVPDYDPLLAKLIVWAEDRERALARMDRALSEFGITGKGMSTTKEFLREVVVHPLFRRAKHSTGLVGQMRVEADAD